METEDVIKDYRDDWLQRNIKVKGLDLQSLDAVRICWNKKGSSGELAEYMELILEGIKDRYAPHIEVFGCSDAKVRCDIMLLWDLKRYPLDKAEIRSQTGADGRIIYVTDDADKAEQIKDAAIIYTGGIYGAGLSVSAMPDENESTNVIDFFSSQLFAMTNRKSLKNLIYSSTHGICSMHEVQALSDIGYVPLMSFEDGKYMYEFSLTRPDERFYFDNTYGGDLKLLHEMLFKLLVEFDRICKKHDIKYFLGGGTLLGAIRHKGMIPWDDDVDVMMLRDDYNKFLSVVDAEISKGFFFQSSKTDSEYHSIFTKIRLDGTKFVTKFSSRFTNMHQGIFIDIFVHDKTSDNKLLQKLHVFETLFARSMVFHKWEGTPMHFYGKLKLICKLATSYIKKHDMKHLEKIQDKVIEKYNNKNTEHLYDGTGEHLRHGAFPSEWLKGIRYGEFNGRQFPVPKESEKYLSYSYGDYNNWIPASLRKAGHDIIEVDFGEYK